MAGRGGAGPDCPWCNCLQGGRVQTYYSLLTTRDVVGRGRGGPGHEEKKTRLVPCYY